MTDRRATRRGTRWNRGPKAAPGKCRGTRALILVVLGVWVVLCACAENDGALTPTQLAGLPRTRLERGDTARRAIAREHGKDVAPVASEVATYGAEGGRVLFASRFADPRSAARTVTAMRDRMVPGGTPFTPPLADTAHPDTWRTVGPGGHHRFWNEGTVVYWLQGDPAWIDAARLELP